MTTQQYARPIGTIRGLSPLTNVRLRLRVKIVAYARKVTLVEIGVHECAFNPVVKRSGHLTLNAVESHAEGPG